MKNLKVIMLAGALAAASSASAQFANPGYSASSENISGYNRMAISYNNTHFGLNKQAGGSDNNFNLNGVGLNYIHGFSISGTLPMFIETGLNLNFGFGSESSEKYEVSDEWVQAKENRQFIDLQVPVNFAYRFNITDGVYVSPYIGLNFKVNLIGRFKDKVETSLSYSELKDYGINPNSLEGDWLSVFSKDDMGSNDATWNRFQMGWHIGAGLQYERFYIGLQYGTDFIPAFKYKKAKINTGNLKISLGYCF